MCSFAVKEVYIVILLSYYPSYIENIVCTAWIEMMFYFNIKMCFILSSIKALYTITVINNFKLFFVLQCNRETRWCYLIRKIIVQAFNGTII